MKIMDNHGHRWNSSQLGSSEGFWRSRTSVALGGKDSTGFSTPDPRNPWNLMKSNENLVKPWKIDEIAATWDRVKVSKGAGPRWHSAAKAPTGFSTPDARNPWNLMKSHETKKSWKSMKCQPAAIEYKGFWRSRTSLALGGNGPQVSRPPTLEFHEILLKHMKIIKTHGNRWNNVSSHHYN
jgi:hypothetical protein